MESTHADSEQHVAELALEPLSLRDKIGLTLVFLSLCVVSLGGALFFGGAWGDHRSTGTIGGAVALGGGAVFVLTVWWLQPHKAAKHASHRLRHHARRLRFARGQGSHPMSEAEFDALEDAADRFTP